MNWFDSNTLRQIVSVWCNGNTAVSKTVIQGSSPCTGAKMFTVIKLYKRLYIVDKDGNKVYTTPNFVKINNRQQMIDLANKFNELGQYDISSVIKFESEHTK